MFKYILYLGSTFLSRDVVFVFPESHSSLEDFFNIWINPSSGSKVYIGFPTNILAAINIEITGDFCKNLHSFVFKYEGNNLVPYMDMLNAMAKIADHHNFDISFDSESDRQSNRPVALTGFLRQFIGYLNSGHKPLLKYDHVFSFSFYILVSKLIL